MSASELLSVLAKSGGGGGGCGGHTYSILCTVSIGIRKTKYYVVVGANPYS